MRSLKSFSLAVGLSWLAMLSARGASTDLPPTADAYVQASSTYAGKNYGTETILIAKNNGPTNQYTRQSYLKFSLPAGGQPITSAILKVTCVGLTQGAAPLAVFGVDNDSWTETGVTWLNKPGLGSKLASTTVASVGAVYELDVTSFARWEQGGDGVVSLCLCQETQANRYIGLASREAGSGQPVLTITTSETSDTTAPAVTGTFPAGGPLDQFTPLVRVSFSEAMNRASVESAFSMSGGVTGGFTWSGTTVTFVPGTTLAANTVYTVTVGTGATDVAGNALAEPFAFSFMTGPESGSGTGLVGTYYEGLDFNHAVLARVDGTVNFNWGSGSPDAQKVAADYFQVRWEGEVEARFTGTHTFYVKSDDGCRLYVNGQLLIDKWVDQTVKEWSGGIDLVAGQRYPVKFEYYEQTGSSIAVLSWSSGATRKQVIPQAQLYNDGRTLVAPGVAESRPAAGGTVNQLAPSIRVNFSKPMDRASAEAAFSMGVAGRFQWQDTTMIFLPDAPLAPSQAYQASVGVGALDISGNALNAPYQVSFTSSAFSAAEAVASAIADVVASSGLYDCGNNRISCKECEKKYLLTCTDCAAKQAKNAISTRQSFVENIGNELFHVGEIYIATAAKPASDCSSCSGGSAGMSMDLPNLEVLRVLRARQAANYSAFGPGFFCGYESQLFFGGGEIKVFDVMNPRVVTWKETSSIHGDNAVNGVSPARERITRIADKVVE